MKLYSAWVLMIAPTLPGPIVLTVLCLCGVLDKPAAIVIEVGLAIGSVLACDWYLRVWSKRRELLPYTDEPFWERDGDTDEAIGPRLTAEEVTAFHRYREADHAEWRAYHIDGARRRRIEARARAAAEESVWYREAYQAALNGSQHAPEPAGAGGQ